MGQGAMSALLRGLRSSSISPAPIVRAPQSSLYFYHFDKIPGKKQLLLAHSGGFWPIITWPHFFRPVAVVEGEPLKC